MVVTVIDQPALLKTGGSHLKKKAGSEKCLVWTAQDYSEDEAVVEQFALKFGTPELAKAFKENFDKT